MIINPGRFTMADVYDLLRIEIFKLFADALHDLQFMLSKSFRVEFATITDKKLLAYTPATESDLVNSDIPSPCGILENTLNVFSS